MPERPERREHREHGDRGDRGERPERGDRGERPERGALAVLLVEDNEDDYVLVREHLPDEVAVTWCETAGRAREALRARSFDAILLDHGLPDANALSFLEQLGEQYPDCPVIVLTGRDDRALALSAREKGARSYLLKDEIADHLLPTLGQVTGTPRRARRTRAATGSGARFVDTAEQFYRVLLEAMGEGCAVVDRDGIITFANPAAGAMVGRDARELLGARATELFSAPSADRLGQILGQLSGQVSAAPAAAPAPFEAEIAPGRAASAGPALAVRVSTRGMHRADGAFEGGLLVLTDISGQVRARAMREDLIRTTIHDLRNPLAAIVSSLEGAKLDAGEAGEAGEVWGVVGEAIDVSLLCARKMLDLVGDLLVIGRLESGELPLARQDVALSVLIEQAIAGQRPLADARGVDLVGAAGCDHVVSVDPGLIARVLQNLLDNALTFTPRGGHVAVRCGDWQPPADGSRSADGSRAGPVSSRCVAVSDDGPGISPAVADRVFEKFVTASYVGSGLGLAFCKLAIEAHGGRIWFESEPGRGTTLYFTVPAAGS